MLLVALSRFMRHTGYQAEHDAYLLALRGQLSRPILALEELE